MEREDQQNASSLNALVISVGLTFVGVLTTLLADPNRAASLGRLVLFLPFPVISLNGYVTLQVAAGTLRRSYLVYLEGLLSLGSSPPKDYPRFIGLLHSLVLGWRGMPMAVLSLFTYWSPILTSAGFTVFVLGPVAETAGIGGNQLLAARISYGTLVLMNILTLISASRRSMGHPRRLLADANRRTLRMQAKWNGTTET